MSENEPFYSGYIRRMEEIRRFSAPSLDGVVDADEYSERLRRSFIRIGELAAENRAFLDEVLYPMLRSDRPLTQQEAEDLVSFGSYLVSASDVENIDLPIVALLSERLLKDAQAKGDSKAIMESLDTRLDVCYALMTLVGRVHAYPELSTPFREEGLAIGSRFLSVLSPDRFESLNSDDLRGIVLTDSRYMSVFYENAENDAMSNPRQLDILDRMLAIAEDPYYHHLAEDFDWDYFLYRVLNYYAKTTDVCNVRSFDRYQLELICDRTEDFVKKWQSNPEHYRVLDNDNQVRMLLIRNRCLAGRLDVNSYLSELATLYHRRDPLRYDLNGIYDNLQIPMEYICMLKTGELSEADRQQLSAFYQDIILYAFHMPNNGSLSSMLEYYIRIIERFIEIPGGLTFEEMVLQCLAALHPPTYIHSVMVGKLARCLAGHLIDRYPELLTGICGCKTAEEVREHRKEICTFVYHAGLCHDFGKLPIIDTIFVYGRRLVDLEFELIHTHPGTGYRMLSRYASTRAYADAAIGHHRWYDNSRGYPEDFNPSHSPLKTVIDLILCADCLDAATDSVGRSYSRGKTFDDFIAEVAPESGTHYAPWLIEFLRDERAAADLKAMLQEGRRQTYRGTYHLLVKMHEKHSNET